MWEGSSYQGGLSLALRLQANEVIANGYRSGLTWCLRCDVGWVSGRECWLCGKDDKVWRWGWRNVHPVFEKVEK